MSPNRCKGCPRSIHLQRINDSCAYPHRRKVEWGTDVRRSELPDSIRCSLRSSQAVFRIKADSWIKENAHALFLPQAESDWVGQPGPAIPELLAVESRSDYRIWLRYDNGVCGEVDLSGTPREGVFAAWNDRAFFGTAHLDEHGAVVWGEDEQLDACADYLYMLLTGKTVEELMPGLRGSGADA